VGQSSPRKMNCLSQFLCFLLLFFSGGNLSFTQKFYLRKYNIYNSDMLNEFYIYIEFLLSYAVTDLKMSNAVMQSKASVALFPGDRTTITCKINPDENTRLSWYQHQPDQFPRVLIYETST
jgi:hypothetical protein